MTPLSTIAHWFTILCRIIDREHADEYQDEHETGYNEPIESDE